HGVDAVHHIPIDAFKLIGSAAFGQSAFPGCLDQPRYLLANGNRFPVAGAVAMRLLRVPVRRGRMWLRFVNCRCECHDSFSFVFQWINSVARFPSQATAEGWGTRAGSRFSTDGLRMT